MKNYFEARNLKELCKVLDLPPTAKAKLEIRIELAIAIRKKIEKLRLTHIEAADRTGVGRTVITAILNGNLKSISIDRLIDVAQGLQIKVGLKIE